MARMKNRLVDRKEKKSHLTKTSLKFLLTPEFPFLPLSGFYLCPDITSLQQQWPTSSYPQHIQEQHSGWVPTYWFSRHHKQFHGFYGLLLIFPDLGTDHSQIPIPLWPWYSFLHSNPWLLASIFFRGTFHLPVWPKTMGRD